MRINLEIYNIRGDWAFGLPEAIWAVQKGNYDIMPLTGTNIYNGVYYWNLFG